MIFRKLLFRAFVPVLLCILLVAGALYVSMQWYLALMLRNHLAQKAAELTTLVESILESDTRRSLQQAALFARLPEVQEAYRIAGQGNPDDETDPYHQLAREHLRRVLAPHLQSYEEVMGGKLRLHFHLPNARSLARLWWHRQINRDGVWIDVSDDISAFRQTVLDIARSGQPIRGIEPGRGGFELRGMVPVLSDQGAVLGSVEVLSNLGTVLDSTALAHAEVRVLMNRPLLAISTQLKDPAKYPPVAEDWILASGLAAGQILPEVDSAWLRSVLTEPVYRLQGTFFELWLPIIDYRGQNVGLFWLRQDFSEDLAVNAGLRRAFSIAFFVLMLLLLFAVAGSLEFLVLRPLRLVSDFAARLKQGDFSGRLPHQETTELDRLSSDLNSIAEGVGATARNLAATSDLASRLSLTLRDNSEHLRVNFEASTVAIQELATTAAEVKESAQLAFNNSAGVREQSRAALDVAADGNRTFDTWSEHMERLQRSLEQVGNDAGHMSEAVDHILSIVAEIDDFADRTELLAINASIQAAKGGAGGAGFATVAKATKQLAVQSKTAAANADPLLRRVQHTSGRNAKSARQSLEDMAQALRLLEQSRASVAALTDQIDQFDASAEAVSASSQQQFVAIQQLTTAITGMRNSLQAHHKTITSLDHSARELNEVASAIQQTIARLRW